MAYPQIIYDPGTGPLALQFQRPPCKVPAYELRATRHDNVASSGVRESVLERIDAFLTFELEWVALGQDVQAWSNFMTFALTGRPFAYYADAAQPQFTNYWLEDTNWTAAFKTPGQYSFKVKFRAVVT